MKEPSVDLLSLRTAIEKSWKPDTANLGVEAKDNPALGQCYPTSRVIQYFFPESEIVEGDVITPTSIEKHFWNVFLVRGGQVHLDLTWQQFPSVSSVKTWKILDRNNLGDSESTMKRVELLLERVRRNLVGSRLK